MSSESVQAVWLALIQGLTEFLPISSSAHLILPSILLDWSEQGLAFDVAVHIGTLFAVIIYFRQDIWKIIWNGVFQYERNNPNSQLAISIATATIPASLFGFFAHDIIELYLRTPMIIAFTTITFGLLLWKADHKSNGIEGREVSTLKIRDSVLIGLAQALALIPGVSRSGITMTMGLELGFSKVAAARFSFLLSVPIILLAGGYQGVKLFFYPEQIDWEPMIIGAVISFASAYICIKLFLSAIERIGMIPFVIYRLALGILLLFILL
ncbi:MAG: undecaprenyl-diphosphate phosphatase [Crocinitomicaceae bacterium]|nr:undecaprenyl-diphosphate phosphatase [Crocinitomicaceae bacterium]